MFPVIYSDEFLEHKTGYLHPEKPERLTAIASAIKAAAFAEHIEWRSPTPTSQALDLMSVLQQAHTDRYIHKVQEIASTGGGYLDGDTPISPRSYDVALLAASAWLDGVNAVLANQNPLLC
jgi:acetoin utilization deacetylase AcuC-like enzyme